MSSKTMTAAASAAMTRTLALTSMVALTTLLLLLGCGSGEPGAGDGQRDPNTALGKADNPSASCDLSRDGERNSFAERPSEVRDGQPIVALSFTVAGGWTDVDGQLRRVLDVLEQHGVQASFFIAADAMARVSEATVRRLAAVYSPVPGARRQHLVAPYIAGDALEQVEGAAAAANKALLDAEQAIAERALLRAAGAQMFRFPYSGSCQAMRAVHFGSGRSAVGWHAVDRCGPSSSSCDWIAEIERRVALRGGIVQLHANDASTRAQLAQLITTLQGRGVSLRTLDERAAFPGYAAAAARRTMVIYGAPGAVRENLGSGHHATAHFADVVVPELGASDLPAGARVFFRAHVTFPQPQALALAVMRNYQFDGLEQAHDARYDLTPSSTHFGSGHQDVFYEAHLERGFGAGRWTFLAESNGRAPGAGRVVSWQLVVTRPDVGISAWQSSGADARAQPALVGRWSGERSLAGRAEVSVVPTRAGSPAKGPVLIDDLALSIRVRYDAARGADGLLVTLVHGDSGAVSLPMAQALRGATDCGHQRCEQSFRWSVGGLRGLSALGDYSVSVSADGVTTPTATLSGVEVLVNGAAR